MKEKIKRVLGCHWFLTFVIMGFFAAGFILSSYNLAMLSLANIELINQHGYDAIENGALFQFLEIIASGYLSLFCYIYFKACEKMMVDKITS